ncbi:MAG TPA: CpsD/CapB family tyrosine-protein kinase [Phycisphaerae bacterium]|nr:CpsD/CapB family tyrosine-protein kinase [Phycisphaerae bacterium]HNU43687.1 CpsD/CapB family tyrosine-protein kinase [Phycisphaerae bacterium]
MGRIAEALKRAETERQTATRPATRRADRPVVDLPAPGESVAPPAEAVPPEPGQEVEQPVALVEGLCESLVPWQDRSSLITEQYRSLRTRLLSQNPLYEHRIVAITSAVPREGKSVTSLNLACILAEIRHLRVLVVDGDFRRSSLAGMLNQPEGLGLADVLAGDANYEEVLRPTPIPNLMFVPAGKTRGRSAAELLTAASVRQVFKRMQTDFHYTIVDTPPATTVTDVGIIGQMTSGVMLVIRLGYTQEPAAKSATRLLQANNIPILGCVVIGRDAPGGRYGYGYGYGYYRYYRYYDHYRKYYQEES